MKQISMLALAFALVAGMASQTFAGEACGACPSKAKEAACCAKDGKECCKDKAACDAKAAAGKDCTKDKAACDVKAEAKPEAAKE